MPKRDAIYELLLDYANLNIEIERLLVGLNWTLCQAGSAGIAETAVGGQWQREAHTPLVGRTLAELSLWLRKWDRQQAAIGLAAVNAGINSEADMVYHEGALFRGRNAMENALDWFIPRILGSKVAVIDEINPFHKNEKIDLTHLPLSAGALHPATEVMLDKAEWIFVNGQSIADKTLPRVLDLATNAKVVLYGPQVPWLEEWYDFGVNYLVGSQIDHNDDLYYTIAEGGDFSSLPQAVSYRLCDLDNLKATRIEMVKAAGAAGIRH